LHFSRKLKYKLVSKSRGKLSKGIWFLQDNATPHKPAITHQNFTDLHSEVQKLPAYSSDVAHSDCYLFPNLKKHFKGRVFSNIAEATMVAKKWLAAQPKELFLDGLRS
jgi:hypothetical protein